MTIPLSELEQMLSSGWVNVRKWDLSRVIQPGQVVTLILSDATFEVPATLPGGAVVLGSRQHEFEGVGLVKVRVLQRDV